jgi:hypothetical protein
MPRKEFESFTRLDASDVNTYLMDQSVMTFAGTAARGSAITTPVEGMVTYLEDSNSLQLWEGSRWTSAGGVSSGNELINGAFEINQRNATSTTASQGFVFDRWKQEFDGGTNTYSSQSFTPGAAPVAGYEAANFARVITSGQSTSGQYTQFIQLNEDVRTFAGQTVTLSFFAKAGSGTPSIAPEWRQTFGSGGSSAVFTSIGKVAITTSWARYSFTFAVPSVSGKTIGAGSFYGLNFWLSAGSDFNVRSSTLGLQSNTFDIWGVQLEAGATANVFRRNANSLASELATCQRYFQIYGGNANPQIIANGNAYSGNQAYVFLPLRPEMRGTPSFSSGPAGSFRLHIAGVFNSTTTVVTPLVLTKTSVGINLTSGSGWTNGDAIMFESTAADGVVNISAEL